VRAVTITRHGGPDVLAVREHPDPVAGPGEVLVDVKAAGLNFAEVTARQGLYPDAPKPPCIVGYEGAGVVASVGSGVTSPKPGTRVLYMSRFGGHAEKVATAAEMTAPIPDEMSFEEAAAIPVNYLTAYHMLFRVARVQPGYHVLVHMAAGGVGTAVLQLCRSIGGVTTYGTASAAKHEYVREHGCDHPIDYRTKDYVSEVRRLTDGRGVDVVLDALGGPDWSKGYGLLKPAGMLVAFGMANVNTGGKRRLVHVVSQLLRIRKYSPMTLMGDNKAVAGVNLGHLWDELELLHSHLDALLALYRDGKIRPHIHEAVPFDRAADAFGLLEFGRNRGKVVLVP
jgi:NADPH:quinone reductase-like Zn-dependent oxidoreductase